MKENILITSEMIRAQSGEAAQLLTKLNKLDRNSKQARKIRRQLRKLGVKLSGHTEEQKGRRRKTRFEQEKVRERYRKRSLRTPFMTKKQREKISKAIHTPHVSRRKFVGERLDQVLDTAQQLVLAGYKTPSQIEKRLLEIYPRIDSTRAGKTALQVLVKKNPMREVRRFRKKLGEERLNEVLDAARKMISAGYKTSANEIVKRLLIVYPSISRSRAYIEVKRALGRKNPRRMSLRDAAEKIINSYLKKQPTRKEYSYWIEAWVGGMISKRELTKKIKALLLGRKGAIPPSLRKNPSLGAKEIYGRILAIEAQKGPHSNYPNENFRHDFKLGAKIYGLPDGSILIKGKKKLWKEFDA